MINLNSGFGVGGYGAGLYGNPPITNLPTGYYLDLLTSEYKFSTNLNAWLLASLRKVDDISFLLVSFTGGFDIDSAAGTQLDTLGVIIGQERIVNFQPTGGISPTLDDTTYRLVLKARIFANQWDGLISSFQSYWQALFPGGSLAIQDNMNMTANVILYGSFSSIIVDLINHEYLVPRPQAVLYTYVGGSPGLLPSLGFDTNDSFVAGFDTGFFS